MKRGIMNKLLILLIPTLLHGCGIKDAFTEDVQRKLWDNNSVGLAQLIETKGYYMGNRFPWIGPLWDTFILYDDGSYGFFNMQEDSLGINGVNLRKNIRQVQFSSSGEWSSGGIVSVHRDTIVVDTYKISYPYRSLVRTIYKILDRKTLLKIQNITYDNSGMHVHEYNTKYYFIEADSLPPSNVYLKREKWAWKNKGDWKAYMKRINSK